MRLSPSPTTASLSPPPLEADPARVPDPEAPPTWRWAVLHFPCLDGVTPRGELVMVSDKRHIAEARRRYPDLVLWHERELAMFGDQMDESSLDERAFVAVNRLKLKTRGWYLGVCRDSGEPRVSHDAAMR